MSIEQNDIEIYLLEVKKAISYNRYRIEMNSKRQENKKKVSLYIKLNKLDNCYIISHTEISNKI